MAKTRRVAARRFYVDALEAADQADFTAALAVDGIDEEIAVLRLRLRRFIEEHPEDVSLMFRGIELPTKAVSARYRLSKDAQSKLTGDMRAVLHELDEVWPVGEPHE